jgi:hypothetical protein
MIMGRNADPEMIKEVRFYPIYLAHRTATVYRSKKYRKINEKRHFILERLAFLTLIYPITQNLLFHALNLSSSLLKQCEPYHLSLTIFLGHFCVFLYKLAFKTIRLTTDFHKKRSNFELWFALT